MRAEGACLGCREHVVWDEERGRYISHEPGAPDLETCGGIEGADHQLDGDD